MVRFEATAGTMYPIQAVPFWRAANASICWLNVPVAGTVSSFALLMWGTSVCGSIFSEAWAAQSVAVNRTQSISLHDSRRRSEEHTSELQSQSNLVCRLLLEKKKNKKT